MGKKQFKTESKRLLDLMIHSIYTNKEIFIRELVSNASDAIDKYHFTSLTDTSIQTDDTLEIEIKFDKDDRTISIIDTGIGMTEEELNNNLGTIARSGSKEFMEKLEENKDSNIDIIGQFGVGFYSGYMIADKITVLTKSPYSDKAYKWESTGEDSYTVTETTKDSRGTEIILHLREDNDDVDYSEYLEQWKLESLIKKYSDYVRYPIVMDVVNETPKMDDEGNVIEGEYDTHEERKTLNSMIPLWKKAKKDIKDEDYNEFYKSKFHDWEDPQKVIHVNAEGMMTYNALLYIPKKAPMDYFTTNYEKGLQLYTKGVFIMDKNKDLIPDYFAFVKGLVDTSDISLNISREILQHNRQLKQISKNIEKKIKSELLKMQDKKREDYNEFYNTFGLTLKYGIYQDYGTNKDKLVDLVMWKSSTDDKLTTLKEYKENMHPDQKHIYYAVGKSLAQINNLPQVETLRDKGYNFFYFLDDIDEFAIKTLNKYEDLEFKSINQSDLDLNTEDEKKELEKQNDENKDLLTNIKDSLGDKVTDVKLSSRLKTHPVCIVAGEGVSFEMERVMNQMPGQEGIKAERILELNPNHELFNTLQKASKDDMKDYSELLYNQALLIEGIPIEDPVAFSQKMVDLMIKSSK